MNKYRDFQVGGSIVKQDDRYIVRDNTDLNSLVVGSTILFPDKCTTGHSHPGVEEVYTFINGSGEMEIDNERFAVTAGDIVLIPDGAFHKVYNTGTIGLYFVCVFNGKRNH